ncbi:MAG: CHAD domain-containing protein, partial [Pyrinomonadaceae bacterium]
MAKAKIRGLDCAAPADQMIRLVLRAQVNAMCRHREKAINWKDPEGVHDMRVLSRRLRSAINDLKPCFRKGSLPRPKLSAVADALGSVRDEDVALMALQELKSQVKGVAAEGIKLLIAERQGQRKQSRAALKASIQDSAIDDLRREFLTKLQRITIATPTKNTGPETAESSICFRELGVLVIKERVVDFIAASSCLFHPYQIKKLHKLRILAKRLRYSMELFARCGDEELEEMAKAVAQMQTALGELHDCDVWISALGARLKRLSRKEAVEPNDEKLRAGATWLLEHFAIERMQHYRDALGLWELWQAEKFIEKINALLQKIGSPVEAQPTGTTTSQSR